MLYGLVIEREPLMQKLLTKFRQTWSAADALKLCAYYDKHPMAICRVASGSDRVLVNDLLAMRACALHAVYSKKAA